MDHRRHNPLRVGVIYSTPNPTHPGGLNLTHRVAAGTPGPPSDPNGPGTEPSSGNGGGWTQPSAFTGPSANSDETAARVPVHISRAGTSGSTTGTAPSE
eukprot:6297419-Karenia_brevis.AAC.1